MKNIIYKDQILVKLDENVKFIRETILNYEKFPILNDIILDKLPNHIIQIYNCAEIHYNSSCLTNLFRSVQYKILWLSDNKLKEMVLNVLIGKQDENKG